MPETNPTFPELPMANNLSSSDNNINNQEPGNKNKKNFKKWLLKPWVAIIITIILISGLVWAGYNYFIKNNTSASEQTAKSITEVKTLTIDTNLINQDTINAVGIVQPESKVEIIALTQGTVRGLFFEVGDEVYNSQILVDIFNSLLITSNAIAQTSYINMQNNLEATIRATNEAIRQAEIGIKNAEEGVITAEFSLQSTKDNLANAINLQDKTKEDIQNQAIISYYSSLNTINNTLDQVNYVIRAEGNIQLSGIAATLSAKDPQSLYKAKNSYSAARSLYNSLMDKQPTKETILNDTKKVIEALFLTKTAVDDTINVLNNTVTSIDFSEISLNSQLSSFTSVRNIIVSTQTGTEAVLQGLQNINLTRKRELDALENAVKISLSQLEQAKLGLDNANASLDRSVQAQEQQVIAAKSSLDAASGQVDLSNEQLADLVIKAPINGKITGKFIEIGAEVNPGQKIAEISQLNNVKIEINLPSEQVYLIKVGQDVKINNDLIGRVNAIDPTADPIARQVGVEIFYDNNQGNLISGTFVDIAIPVEKITKTQPDSIFIPLGAVTIAQNESYVFITENINGKIIAKKITIKIGQTVNNLIEVLSGLKNDDQLIIENNKNLMDGEEIKIAN
ncbi:MAG: efflux RND transporter periplasmic adaptor subunit [Patescibacteria group bacterium]